MSHISWIAKDSRSYSPGQFNLACRIYGLLGIDTFDLLQQLPLSILDGGVYHIIQACALVILWRHVKDAIIPHKILDSL